MEYILNGIYLCLGLQLSIVSILLLVKSNGRKRILAAIGFIVSLGLFQVLLYEFFKDEVLFQILIKANTKLFIPPLLYIYLIIDRQSYLIHFIFPTFYLIGSYIIIFGFPTLYNNHYDLFSSFDFTTVLVNFLFYFILGYRYISVEMPKNLVITAYTKYKYFFYLFNLWEVVLLIIYGLVIINLLEHYSSFNLVRGLNFIWGTVLIFYIISESYFFKTRFLNKNISKHPILISKTSEVGHLINQILKNEKKYLESSYSLKHLASDTHLEPDIINQYFNEIKGISLKTYIYRLRIQEFLKLLKDQQNNHYDIGGLAEMAGFNSRATFYRIFKSEQGVTPTEYIKKNH